MGDYGCSSGTCKIGGCKDGCACWSPPSNPDDCDCACLEGGAITMKADLQGSKHKPIPQDPDLIVTISTPKLPIVEIAKILDKFLPNQIAIPVTKVYDEPIELNIKDKTPLQIAVLRVSHFKEDRQWMNDHTFICIFSTAAQKFFIC
jgi:hypothetical protein